MEEYLKRVLDRTMCMIDIETMSIKPNALVYEVGAILFQCELGMEPGVGRKIIFREMGSKLWRLSPNRQLDRHIDPETVLWMHDHPERMAALKESYRSSLTPTEWIAELYDMISRYTMVWCKGPAFDIAILEDLIRYFFSGHHMPWRYSEIRDLRTIDTVLKLSGIDIEQEKPPHDALEDCRVQMNYLLKAFNALWSKSKE